MSLTSMLKGKRDIDIKLQTSLREIIPTKKQFQTISGSEAFSSKNPISAPYNLSNPYNSSVIGIAFDYMARFIVSQKLTTNKDKVFEGINAENGLKIIMKYCDDHNTIKLLENKYNKGIDLIVKFVNHSIIEFVELLPYASYMARLEQIYRSGMLPKDVKGSMLGEEENEIIVDLNRLCEVFIERFMISQVVTQESIVIFNPHFGMASISCGGADADIFIDGTLYDFKTSKTTGYKWSEVAQLFGYYFLHCVANQLNDTSSKLNRYEIKRLAFYKARYGEIEYIDISSMDSEKMEYGIKQINGILKPTNHSTIPKKEIPLNTKKPSRMERKLEKNTYKPFIYFLIFLIIMILSQLIAI